MDPACGSGGGSWTWDGAGGIGDPNPPPDTTKPCATDHGLLNDAVVQQKFSEAWEASRYDAPMDQRKEQGGWILQTPDGLLTAEPFPALWRATPCGIEFPPDAWPPPGALAMYHTHPFKRGDLLTGCSPQDLPGGQKMFVIYSNESSVADDSALMSFRHRGATNLIGLILDADQITAYDGTGLQTEEHQRVIGRCGY